MRLSEDKRAESTSDISTQYPPYDDNFPTVRVVDDIDDLYGKEREWYFKGQTWISLAVIGLIVGLVFFIIRRRRGY